MVDSPSSSGRGVFCAGDFDISSKAFVVGLYSEFNESMLVEVASKGIL